MLRLSNVAIIMNKFLEKIGIKATQEATPSSLLQTLKAEDCIEEKVIRVKDELNDVQWTSKSKLLRNFLLKKRKSKELPESLEGEYECITKRINCKEVKII